MAADAMRGGYPVQSSAEAGQDSALLRPHLRPNLVRRDTDQILSYYQSEHAGRPYYDAGQLQAPDARPPPLTRRDSQSSRSSSEYSAESFRDTSRSPEPPPRTVPSHSQHTRRPSVPSQESADRRRLAIIEVDPALPPSVSRRGSDKGKGVESGVSSALLARRGLHVNGLALVAPPDASPATYTNLTPPPTAPVFPADRHDHVAPSAYTHSRSASEAVGSRGRLRHHTSRDVGIVGTSAIPAVVEMSPPSTPPASSSSSSYVTAGGLQAPIFQTPGKSRTPSPAAHTPELSNASTTSYGDYSFFSTPSHHSDGHALTPAIGEGKDVRQPVVGPVVVDLDSDRVMRQPMQPINSGSVSQSPQSTSQPGSYLFYQPGMHSTAGPLPPPPMSLFDSPKPSSPAPPRPPRLRTPLQPAVSPAPSSSKSNLDTLKESLQLPPSVSSKLASRAPSRATSRPELSRSNTDTSLYSINTDLSNDSHASKASKLSEPVAETKRTRSVHRREGAFAPSSTSTPNDSPQLDTHGTHAQYATEPNNAYLSPTAVSLPVVEPDSDAEVAQTRRPAMELRREPSWVSVRETNMGSSPNGKAQRLPDSRSASRSPTVRSPPLPPLPPPKTHKGGDDVRTPSSGSGSSNPFRATLNNLKRFSALPRTPSSLSIRSVGKSGSTPTTSRPPSPSPVLTPKASPRPRIVNPRPDALNFRDVSIMKNPIERAEAYSQKIKELGMYDTGLTDWVIATIENGVKSSAARRSSPNPIASPPSVPSEFGGKMQPRHVAQASVDSEATFPRRADAYPATDLTMRADEVILPEAPPIPVPYPSIAMGPVPRVQSALPAPSRSYQVPLASGSSRSGHGFFASIGRRASLRNPMSPPSPSRTLKKSPRESPPAAPRPVEFKSTPAVRGGPRAPPHRMSRSQTISVPPPPQEQPPPPPVGISRSETMVSHRQSTSSRRPSLFHRSVPPPAPVPSVIPSTPAAPAPVPLPAGPEFEQQVDKLADLLPHADRNVLAGYLRRAGQDILAIGQYLEDEKNGTLRYD